MQWKLKDLYGIGSMLSTGFGCLNFVAGAVLLYTNIMPEWLVTLIRIIFVITYFVMSYTFIRLGDGLKAKENDTDPSVNVIDAGSLSKRK